MSALGDGFLRRAGARVGATLSGTYRLERLLGAGGMGAVYAAKDPAGRELAIKVLHEVLALDPRAQRRFRREAHVANRVGHPGAIPVLADGEAGDGSAYLVMPLLAGETLASRLRRSGQCLPARDVVVIAYAILDVLASAHDGRIVHRDIKPDNVFLTRDGAVKVLDFGIARLLDASHAGSATESGAALGTPAFMAPEQVVGRDARAATDLWGVGATMFTALAGRHVHTAHNLGELLMRAGSDAAAPLRSVAPDVPDALAAVVDRALAFEPGARWKDARSMQSALARAYADSFGEPLAVDARGAVLHPMEEVHFETTQSVGRSAFAPDSRGDRGPGPAKRRRLAALALSVTLAAIGGGAASVHASRAHGLSAREAAASAPAGEDEPSSVPRANALYESAMQAARDASRDPARRDLEEATKLDPSFAAAHLGTLLTTYYFDDGSRAHYERALHARADLGARSRALLDALEPALRVPPDHAESARRLRAVAEASPRDADAEVALARASLHAGELRDAIAAAARAAALEPTWAAPHLYAALAHADGNEIDEARRAYDRCVEIAPTATSCLLGLVNLAITAGRCEDAASLSRRLITAEPQSDEGYYQLALALAGNGDSLEGARAALEQRSARLPGDVRARRDRETETELAILSGSLDGALERAVAWEKEASSTADEQEHFLPVYTQMLLLLELGRRADAAAVAQRFGQRAAAWSGSDVFDYDIFPYDVRYLAGAISRSELAGGRAGWLARAEHNASADPATRWLAAYAVPALTASDAAEALAALPRDNPFGSSFARNAESESAIGHVYLLANRPAEAATHLRLAVTTCSALEAPIPETQAFLHLGAALERMGDHAGACNAYGRVVTRWGSSKSISARRARLRRDALACGRREATANARVPPLYWPDSENMPIE